MHYNDNASFNVARLFTYTLYCLWPLIVRDERNLTPVYSCHNDCVANQHQDIKCSKYENTNTKSPVFTHLIKNQTAVDA